MQRSVFKALKLSIPVFFCYFPLGIVYGLLFVEQGYPWYLAPVFSAFIFAGAMQFLALSFMAAGGSLAMLSLALIPLGIRNVFYGLTMLERFRKTPPLLKGYLAHGLVDATYSILMMHPEEDNLAFTSTLTVVHHLYWIVGTFVGAFCSNLIPMPKGLEFSLAAFFMAMAVEQLLKSRDLKPLLLSLGAISVALIVAPSHFFLASLAVVIVSSLTIPQKVQEAV